MESANVEETPVELPQGTEPEPETTETAPAETIMIDGKEFNMGSNLSTLSIVRMERDPRSPAIDWGESNKYKAELIEKTKGNGFCNFCKCPAQ